MSDLSELIALATFRNTCSSRLWVGRAAKHFRLSRLTVHGDQLRYQRSEQSPFLEILCNLPLLWSTAVLTCQANVHAVLHALRYSEL
jgi:hypothetical protein